MAHEKRQKKFNQSAPEMESNDLDGEDFNQTHTYSGMSLGYHLQGFRNLKKNKNPVNPLMTHASIDKQLNGKEFRVLVKDKNHKEMNRRLANDSSLVDACSHYTQDRALHIAARNGDIKALNFLLDYFPDITAKNKSGETAYDILKAFLATQQSQLQISATQTNPSGKKNVIEDLDFDDVFDVDTDAIAEKNEEDNEEFLSMLDKLKVNEPTVDNKVSIVKTPNQQIKFGM